MEFLSQLRCSLCGLRSFVGLHDLGLQRHHCILDLGQDRERCGIVIFSGNNRLIDDRTMLAQGMLVVLLLRLVNRLCRELLRGESRLLMLLLRVVLLRVESSLVLLLLRDKLLQLLQCILVFGWIFMLQKTNTRSDLLVYSVTRLTAPPGITFCPIWIFGGPDGYAIATAPGCSKYLSLTFFPLRHFNQAHSFCRSRVI